MISIDRLPTFVTRSTQTLLRCRLNCARRGEAILRRKSDGLIIQFRSVLGKFMENKARLEEVLKEASFSLAEVKYLIGGFNQLVLQSIEKAKVKVNVKTRTIGGVKIEGFETVEGEGEAWIRYAGLARGRQQVLKSQSYYKMAIEHLVELATLQRAFIGLEGAIKKITIRVNALCNSIIPQLEATLFYVSSELEEHEREEFFRLKKVQRKRRGCLNSHFAGNAISLKENGRLEEEDEDLLF